MPDFYGEPQLSQKIIDYLTMIFALVCKVHYSFLKQALFYPRLFSNLVWISNPTVSTTQVLELWVCVTPCLVYVVPGIQPRALCVLTMPTEVYPQPFLRGTGVEE